jgi:GNAT superfamily N-acetyltransferase
MALNDGYTPLPDGKIAAVVTYLEMRSRHEACEVPQPEGVSVRLVEQPDLNWYRDLFRRVGQDWLWFSRLRMNDDELKAAIHDERVDVFALSHHGEEKGLLEIDRRGMPDIELKFFGLTMDLAGQGVGRYLMNFAIDQAWSHQPERFFVHTCTSDSQRALAFYVKSGFVPYSRGIEVGDDPRLNGGLPEGVARHVAIIRPAISAAATEPPASD